MNTEEFNKMLETVKKLTERNDHTAAYLAVAKFFNLMKYEAILNAILTIQKLEHYIPTDLYNYRYEVTRNMLLSINKNHGEKIFNQVNNCL